MNDCTLGFSESRFADIIWENSPMPSSELVKLALKELGWKKSTTYTVLRRLSEKGLFKNEEGTVTPLITREEFYAIKSESVVEENFGGSLPKFVASFTSRKKLTQSEVDELYKIIELYKKGED